MIKITPRERLAAGTAIGFVLAYAAAEYLHLPRIIVEPSPIRVSVGRTLTGMQMGYYGLGAWGIFGGLLGAVVASVFGFSCKGRGVCPSCTSR